MIERGLPGPAVVGNVAAFKGRIETHDSGVDRSDVTRAIAAALSVVVSLDLPADVDLLRARDTRDLTPGLRQGAEAPARRHANG